MRYILCWLPRTLGQSHASTLNYARQAGVRVWSLLLTLAIPPHSLTNTRFQPKRANVTIPECDNSGSIIDVRTLATPSKTPPSASMANISRIHLKEKVGDGQEAVIRSMPKGNPIPMHHCTATPLMRGIRSVIPLSMSPIRLGMFLLSIAGLSATLSLTMSSQSLVPPTDPIDAEANAVLAQPDRTYVRPTEKTKLRNYAFDAYGPYPIFGSAFAAGFGQLSNSPPEWGQGAEGFSKRMGSDFAIAATGTTVRYGLAQAFKEDTLYYRCACKGVLPRLSHAVLSTLTARRGEDGHRVFSVPALLAPYAGSFTAVYGWYPNRFGAKDAFRIGNYTLLANMGGNIGLEFIYSGPHSLLSRMHLNNGHGAPTKGPNN